MGVRWGSLADYSRRHFTLDEGLSKAVRKVFVDLYKKGWIYRGEFIINWDPAAHFIFLISGHSQGRGGFSSTTLNMLGAVHAS